MKLALQYSFWAVGLWLNLRVISALVRGSYRQYPFVFAYSLTLFLSTVIEIGIKAAPQPIRDTYYWTDEIILDVLVFCMVIAFIGEAAKYSRQKPVGLHWLILAGVLIIAASLALRSGLPLNLRMTLISRDLNICAVILDLILWSLLVTARRPDRTLLLLSGGLGLQLTGAIMGEQLRQLAHKFFFAGTLLEVTTGLLALFIWWRALRPSSLPARVPA